MRIMKKARRVVIPRKKTSIRLSSHDLGHIAKLQGRYPQYDQSDIIRTALQKWAEFEGVA